MNLNEFQELSKRTMRVDSIENNLVNCCMGIAGETGEVIDIIKKSVFQGHELDNKKVQEELGDVMFYLSNLANTLDIKLEDAIQDNVIKLSKRYPNGFNEADSIKRVDVK